ncbi:hypothetical protein GO988_05095 [Hymenobacter sp. HMF4947]|uniref:Uncharacterized protein n=1 Tax=Hymenobacter ginkgonis TaxID=2682976 RepID=A0A7K1TBB4_9BACT|nr:hypothetical protein [Hymenobacter ginkgonis]MVN75696.1 hypothetical protein [Hymenobacter ginkgonis]
MKMGVLTSAGRARHLLALLLVLLAGLTLGSCRTCPIDSCHIRKAHYHNGAKYRARPIWKMQYPAIGEKYKVKREGDGKRHEKDQSKSLK